MAQKICTLWFQFFGAVFASKRYPFKNIFDFTTAGDWDWMAAVERLPALHYSVDFIFLSFEIMDFIVELKTTRGSLMKPKWQKLASLAQKICTLWFQFFGAVFASKGYPFKNIFTYKETALYIHYMYLFTFGLCVFELLVPSVCPSN